MISREPFSAPKGAQEVAVSPSVCLSFCDICELFTQSLYRVVDTLRRAHKWAQNELNLRLKVISFAIMTPSEQFNVS